MSALLVDVPPQQPVAFDVDAMLMYGWVADAQRNVTHVNNSLRRWIRGHAMQAKAANELLERIDRSEAVSVQELLATLLDKTTEESTPALVCDYMTKLEERLASHYGLERDSAQEGPYRVLLQYHSPERGAPPLVGARFVRDSATLLASRRNAQRVDIVVVAVVEQDDGWWRIKGFQGQLQEAWLRVKNRVSDGNRAGSIALMARNLSHNIGSHALYWVANGASKDQKDFLNYLQVRMELLAGFATGMPLSPVPADLPVVVKRFKESRLLLSNICRSESVSNIRIEYSGGDLRAIFFGGEIGVHAFYSILENCVRDSAKFAPKRSSGSQTLKVCVRATPLDHFIQIDVFDEAGNFEQHGPSIQSALERIRISDTSGALEPHYWGIKERFVCAAILRGLRPEALPLQESAEPESPWLGPFKRDQHRILELVNVDGNCAWRLFLPRRHVDVLVVSDNEHSTAPTGTEITTFVEFEESVKSPTGITTPFVVLDHLPEHIDTRTLEGKLPHRTFLRGGTNGSRFPQIDLPVEELTATALLRKSVEKLGGNEVRLIVAIKAAEQLGDLRIGATYEDPRLHVVDDTRVPEELTRLRNEYPNVPFVVYKRHWFVPQADHSNFLLSAKARGIIHFELFGDRALQNAIYELRTDRVHASYRLLEAALTKILIVDERLDLTQRETGKEIMRLSLYARGIRICGSEFVAHATREHPATLKDLTKWSRGFHFVMLHRGIAQKLYQDPRAEVTSDHVISTLEADGVRVLIHSGRMGMADMPDRTKFLSLANVTTWIDHDYSKLQVLDELLSLRRV
jgi:hypothetical protein